MTSIEAQKILGLRQNATPEEIKKAYHNLVKKHHPDNFKEGSIEQRQATIIMQEINDAKALLLYNTKKSNNNSSSVNKGNKGNNSKKNSNQHTTTTKEEDVFKLKKEIIEALNSVRKKTNVPKQFERYYDEISSIISNYIMVINKTEDTSEIRNLLSECTTHILEVYFNLLKEFFDMYEIDEDDIKEKISLYCSFDEFYNQLLRIKEKYGFKYNYRKKLEQDLHDYTLRPGYTYLKSLIEVEINNILIRLKINKYNNYGEELNKGKKVIEDLFTDYFKYLSQFNEISVFLEAQSLRDSEILKIFELYKKAWNDFNKHVSLYDTEQNLNKIVSLIKEYQKHQQLSKDLLVLDEDIKTIINNYHAVLSKLTYPSDLGKAELATKTLNEVFETINRAKLGLIPVEACKQLVGLKFENYDEDKNLLNSINGVEDSEYGSTRSI